MVNFIKEVLRDAIILSTIFGVIIGISLIFSENTAANENYNKIMQKDKISDKSLPELVWSSSTEYFLPRDHNGSSIVKLRDNLNNFINTSCFLTILFPDRTIFLPEIQMQQDLNYGSYYQHWDIPQDIIGVYDQEVLCEFKNKNISSAKAFHVNNITSKILESISNVSQIASFILSNLNCTDTQNFATCEYLSNISQSIINLTNLTIVNNQFLMSNISSMSETIININTTLNDHTKIYYAISAPNCIIGHRWHFQANVTNEENENLPFLNCTLSTSVFGSQTVPFNTTTQNFALINPCVNPEQLVNWDFDCVR